MFFRDYVETEEHDSHHSHIPPSSLNSPRDAEEANNAEWVVIAHRKQDADRGSAIAVCRESRKIEAASVTRRIGERLSHCLFPVETFYRGSIMTVLSQIV